MKAGRSSLSDDVDRIHAAIGSCWLPGIYRDRILKTRTRAYHFGSLPERAHVEIHHTLLGVELKIGRRRLLCPDLATARYLSVFAKAGCEDVAIPYDITKLSCFADELESAWQRMFLLIERDLADEPRKILIRGLIIAKLRKEIAEAGAGAPIPHFKQSTKQRR